MDKHMFIKDAVAYLYRYNGGYEEERILPYIIVERDPMRREVIKQTLDYYLFDCLCWGNNDPRILISIDWKRYTKAVAIAAHFASKDDHEYTTCEFMNEVLKPFIDRESEIIPSFTSNREEIEKSDRCVCINCYSRFSSNEITEWSEDEEGDTACCPYCYADTVAAEPHEGSIPLFYLEKWHKQLFSHDEK